jgi:hypothetical protein
MSTRFHACVALLAATTMLAAGSGVRLLARGIPNGLVIRVFDLTGVDGKVRSAAIVTAGAVLAEAGIQADWRACARSGPDTTACEPPVDSSTLLVRFVRGSGETPRDEALAMGYAVIEPASGVGALATIFPDRVEHVAHSAGSDYATLLGRAIAHEVGHLLLGSNTHARSGLMRAQWTQQEIVRNRPEDWTFSWRDRDQLGLAGLRVADSASR